MMASEKNGWIKLHRKMLDNPIIMKDAEYLAVWMYLLLNATHAEYPALFKGKKIMLQPGQLITGRKSIAEELSVNESKVRRIMDAFENDQQIDRQRSNKNTLVSLKNWDKYQIFDLQNDQQSTNNRPTTDQQPTTNNNDNNIKNERNNIISDSAEPKPPKKVKHKYGEYKNVLLTDEELEKLKNEYPDYLDRIERLSSYVESTGRKYKSHYATIRNWARNDKKTVPQTEKVYDDFNVNEW